MTQEDNLSKRVLIVDDSKANRLILSDYLQDSGFVVQSAANGKDGFELAKQFSPDLILLDIIMDGIDGFETLELLKGENLTKNIPVVFMSSLSQTEHKIKGFKIGAVDYIIKPFQQEEVLARVTAHITIQQQKKQLNELIATKDKLFSIIAHDLRTPFNSLIGYSDLLLQQYQNMSEEKILKAIDRINTSSKQALTMLENLLTWARTQMGVLSWHSEEINLHLLVNSVLALLKVGAQKKKIFIENLIENTTKVYGSHEMLSTVLRNLLSNAIKYTENEGTILIESHEEAERVTISVTDSGVGIAPENLEKIFRIDKKFSTLGTANERGTGLGLMLCKEFVEKHQGQITVESQVGEGTVFSVTLPKPSQ